LAPEPELGPREREGADSPEAEAVELDGPDPRTWPGSPEIWDWVLDIEVLDRVIRDMAGSDATAAGPAYPMVAQLLTAARHEARGQLAMAIARAYMMMIPEGGTPTAFEAAGKPRAYGSGPDRPPPSTV